MFRISFDRGWSTVIIGFLTLSGSGVFALEQGQSCVNPRGESGRCILAQECKPIIELFKASDTTQEQHRFIQSCKCGTVGYKQLVCCVDPNSSSVTTHSEVLPEPPTCGLQLIDRVLSGQETEPDEFPWTALIKYKNLSEEIGFHCGGSLISQRHVLTAAHCVNGLPLGMTVYRVRLGEGDLTTDPDCYKDANNKESQCFASPIDLEPFKIITHEGYDTRDANKANDIALIRFAKDVEYSDTIQPICLPLSQALRRKDHTGTLGWAVGWGKTEHFLQSNTKLKVQLPINSLRQCSPAYQHVGISLKSVHLCAGGRSGKDTCTGDSGGPLMRTIAGTWYLLGVVSFGPELCGTPGVSGVYVNVAEYIDWIQENIK